MNPSLTFETEPFELDLEAEAASIGLADELGDAEDAWLPEAELARRRRPSLPRKRFPTRSLRPSPRPRPKAPVRRPRPPFRRPWPSRSSVAVHPAWPAPPANEPTPAAGPDPDAGGAEFVRWVQDSLNRILDQQLTVDGRMTPETRQAIRDFQRRMGLLEDGIIGPETQQALVAERQKLAARPPAKEEEFAVPEAAAYARPRRPPARETPMVRSALRSGITNENQLADLVFFRRHPERNGRAISRSEPNYRQLSQEWLQIRDALIRPLLRGRSPTPPARSAPAAPAAPAVPRQPPPAGPSGNEPQVTVNAGVRVSDHAVRVLQELLRMAGLSRATITSGRRTPSDQARIMYDLIERHGVSYAKNLYGSTGDQVIDVYSAQKAAGQSATVIKQAMEAKINQLGCARVSHHCSHTHDVMDVAPSSLADHTAFRQALDAALRSGLIDKYIPPPQDPAFHIEVVLNPTANELMARILRSPPLPLDAFLPRGARLEMD
jgi:hypothetical protein